MLAVTVKHPGVGMLRWPTESRAPAAVLGARLQAEVGKEDTSFCPGAEPRLRALTSPSRTCY